MNKIKIFFAALLLLLPLGTWADELSVTVLPGAAGQYKVAVSLTNSAVYEAFQLDVVLPSGATFTDGAVTAASRLSGYTVQAINHPNGYVRVTAHQGQNKSITGTSGILFTLNVEASSLSAEQVTLHNCLFTTTSMEEVTLYLAGSGELSPEQQALNAALQALVDEVNAYLAENNYPTISEYSALNKSLTSAKQALDNLLATQALIDQLQSDYDAYRAAVEAALEAQRQLNEALAALVAEGQTVQADALYGVIATATSKALDTLIKTAQTELGKGAATQSTIDSLTKAIADAKAAIEAQRALNDALSSVVTDAQSVQQDELYGAVSSATASALESALQQAQSELSKGAATQSTIDTLTAAIQKAQAEIDAERERLVGITSVADRQHTATYNLSGQRGTGRIVIKDGKKILAR